MKTTKLTRAQRAEARREKWHRDRVDDAATPRERLWAACGWLIAEAARRSRMDDAVERVLAAVDDIREDTR